MNYLFLQKGSDRMRKVWMLLLCIALLAGSLVLPVSAESVASKVDSIITVTNDGDCIVSTTVQLHLDSPMDSLSYPVPANATDVALNGSMARTNKTDSAIEIDVSRVIGDIAGDTTFAVTYNIPGAVRAVKGAKGELYLQLELPLLNSFQLPVSHFSFIITMPDNIKYYPTFTSIYQQTGIDAALDSRVDKNMLTGSSNQPLNDHEAILMTMVVPQEMFPTVSTYIREGNPEVVPMLVCAGVALLYWLLFLRTWPLIRRRSVTPPEGVTAGELGAHLTLAGGDLTMMIFNWAQLGYVLIHREGARVMVHKRMDMGNERSPFEVKCYKMLFANRRSVDATSYQYAKLSRKVFAMIPGERNLVRPNSGNTKIFRALGCGVHMICGVCIAMNMTTVGFLQTVLSIILVVVGAVSAWQIHEIAYRTHLRGKTRVYIGLVCILLWILLGILCGQVWIPLCCSLGQWIFGYFAAYGGRRSDLGRHDAGQVLGLRRYVKRLPKEDISRFLKNDPDYYFNYAPYALAMGVINPYSRSFGQRKLEPCPYLITKVTGRHTALEWGHILADTADLMDHKARRMQIEKWLVVQVKVKKK